MPILKAIVAHTIRKCDGLLKDRITGIFMVSSVQLVIISTTLNLDTSGELTSSVNSGPNRSLKKVQVGTCNVQTVSNILLLLCSVANRVPNVFLNEVNVATEYMRFSLHGAIAMTVGFLIPMI